MISIIIPTLNESKIDFKLEKGINAELIIIDSKKGIKGRALQMNFGAKLAKGDILMFLHADTKLPKDWHKLVNNSLKQNDYGCFKKKFDSNKFLFRVIELGSYTKTLLLKEVLGDNTLFIKKKLFEEINGFKNIELMEDVEISRRLRKYKMDIVKEKVISSSRRFEKNGIIKTILLMQKLRLLYLLGVPPKKLEKMYK